MIAYAAISAFAWLVIGVGLIFTGCDTSKSITEQHLFGVLGIVLIGWAIFGTCCCLGGAS